jgi:hypothetical protein
MDIRRKFLMEATKYTRNHTVGGYYLSEKLDGVRAFWDGGLSRGLKTTDIPYASVNSPRTLIPKAPDTATGLWSKEGKVIKAPDWFLNQLPCLPLDGEIWLGRGRRKDCKLMARGKYKDAWKLAEYAIFDSPSYEMFFQTGSIVNQTIHLQIDAVKTQQWAVTRTSQLFEQAYFIDSGPIEKVLAVLRDYVPSEGQIYLAHQRKLPVHVLEAEKVAMTQLVKILKAGGEGIILRDPEDIWQPQRSLGYLYCEKIYD